METVEIVIGEDGLIQEPRGVTLKVPSSLALCPPDVAQRRVRLQALWKEIDARLDDAPRQPWPENDPVVEKFRRKGLLD